MLKVTLATLMTLSPGTSWSGMMNPTVPPAEWREAYEERLAMMTVHGEMPADEAHRLAVGCVEREFGT